ncbi:hypothetical protein P154DRAFT_527499 [Amniculicola lignicola CBS 123094]|uniref:Uncharacterized protein n=1 Tax=Amniculicola lignicola CBS 123094 TaxID=1392246 RepID=A0A6A5W3U7_9PLEO|nr:hypothetical protein P154DRAFT_527499 [Amniculicola lignicola CBS 123094]
MASSKIIALGDKEVEFAFRDFNEEAGELKSDALDEVGEFIDSDYRVAFHRVHEIHGAFETNSDDDSTLLVLKVTPRSTSGRSFKHLRLQMTFEKGEGSDADDITPQVWSYEPGQDFIQVFNEQITKVTKERAFEAGVSAQAPVGGGGSLKSTNSTTKEFEERKLHKLDAGAHRSNTKLKKADVVWWEIAAAEESNGIGDHIVVAVLVKRAVGSEFVIRVETKGGFEGFRAGVKGGFKDMLKKVPFHKSKEISLGPFGPLSGPEPKASLPADVNINNLHAASQGNVLKDIAYVHLPEAVIAKLYEKRTEVTMPAATIPHGAASDQAIGGADCDEPAKGNISVPPAIISTSTSSPSPTVDSLASKARPSVVSNPSADENLLSPPQTKPPVFPSSRAIRHRKMAALYERLAQLHREEAEEALAGDESVYADHTEGHSAVLHL